MDKRPYSKAGTGNGGKPFKPAGASKPRPAGGFKPAGAAKPRPAGAFKPAGAGASKPRPAGAFKPRPAQPAKPAAPAKPANRDARRVALWTLSDVVRKKAFAQLALDERLREAELEPDDRRLATAIFYAALENRLYLNWVFSTLVAKMPGAVVEDILHVAAAQLLYMDRVPDHSAVDEAVKLTKALNLTQYAALVNGTLRSLIRARDAGQLVYPGEADSLRRFSVTHSLPEPLAKRLIDDYGMDTALAVAAYKPAIRYQIVRPNLLKTDRAAFEKYLTQKGWKWSASPIPGAYRLEGAGDLGSDEGFFSGLFSIQGEGSMLAALAVEAGYGMNILDACAAPGGKAALICEAMGGSGRVQAWEIHETRAKVLEAVKKRLKLDNLRVFARDATIPRPECEEAFDAVLVDAPCSGLGVMHEKPDLKYRVTDEDVSSLCALQAQILDACAPYVKPGGRLVYSTCTLFKAENEDQAAAFLARHPEFERDTDTAWIPEPFRAHAKDGMLTLLPPRDGTEGFFIARLRRRPL